MSYKATAWAYAQPVTPSGAKFVLVALADFADESHSCYPGQDRLAEMTGQSVESVRRHLKALEGDGYIARARRVDATGYRTSDRYTLAVGQDPTRGGQPLPEPAEAATETPAAPAAEASPEGLPVILPGRESQTGPTGQSVVAPTGQSAPRLPVNLPDLTGQFEGVTIREPSGNRKGGRSASRRKPETPIPADWHPSQTHQVFALEHGLELSSEAMKFRTHAAANDRRLRSWDAGFTMWLQKAREFAPKVDPAASAWSRARRVGEGWS